MQILSIAQVFCRNPCEYLAQTKWNGHNHMRITIVVYHDENAEVAQSKDPKRKKLNDEFQTKRPKRTIPNEWCQAKK